MRSTDEGAASGVPHDRLGEKLAAVVGPATHSALRLKGSGMLLRNT